MAIEQYFFVDSDDVSFQIAFTSSRVLLGHAGMGMADVEHFAQRIPSQHRSLYLGHKFRPRYLTFRFLDLAAGRDAMWSHHQDWLGAFNPDKGEGYIRVILSDGTERRLDCRFNDGLKFDSDARDGPFVQGDIVQVQAMDPFLYNPTQQSESDNFNGATPVDIALTNNGHMGAYPTIVISGAVTNPKLTLVSTSEVIEFTTTVGAGSHIDIDTQEGTIHLNDVDMDPLTLTKPSVLFSIPRGAQILRLTCTSGTSQATVTWYDRFLGI